MKQHKITAYPSQMRLAAALFPEKYESLIMVRFKLGDDREISCTVTSVHTDQGQILVCGSYADDDGKLKGFYEADLVGETLVFK